MKESIEKIIRLLYHYRTLRNVSPLTLLKESGYIELYKQITEEEIAAVLKLQPHLVAEWLLWSDNKRSTPAWHFVKFDDGCYLVEYSTIGKEHEEINTIDEFIACSAFIKREVEDIREFV